MNIILILLLVLPVPAFASQIYPFPNLTRKDTDTHIVTKLNLPDETVVQHEKFSLTVPKGWSINPVGPSDNAVASITATPTSDVENSKTYISFHIRTTPSTMTLEERKTQNEKKGRTAKFVSWHDQRWLLVQYFSDNERNKRQKYWAAFTNAGGTEFWTVAGTPEADASKYEGILLKIMESSTLTKNK